MNIGSLFLLCAIVLTGCNRLKAQSAGASPGQAGIAAEAIYRRISAAEANKIMQEGQEYILLDVRTEGEYREKHIEGAILIPDYEIQNRAEKELPDKNKLILVYCQSGRRSANAARALLSLGYVNVYDFGGIINWPYKTIN